MIKTIKPSPFIRDVGITAVTSIITTLAIIIVTRLLAQGLGPKEFGAYILARWVLAFVSPFSTLAMGVALARYIAISNDRQSKNSYLLSGLFLGVIPSFIVLMTGLMFMNKLTIIIFHNEVYSSLVTATLLMIVGYSFYNVLYSYYRGANEMWKANLLQLGIMAIAPIIIAWKYVNFGRADLIVLLRGACFFIPLLPLTLYIIKSIFHDKQIIKVGNHLKELFWYGLPRVPAGLALSGILFVGPFLAPYFGSLKEAGYLVVGQSMLTIVENALFAFGIVALPKVAQLFAEGRNEFLKERAVDIIALVFHLGLFATLHLFLWSDQIVLIWLGNQYTEAIPLMMAILLGLIPYLVYVMLRSVIDAIEVRAVNTYNLYLSFGITLVVSLLLAMIGLGTMGLAIGATTGFLVLGLLTVFYLWKVYRFKINIFKIKECLLLNTIFIAIAFVIKYRFIVNFKGITLISMAFLGESILFFIYFLILKQLKVRWISELGNRVFGGVN